MIPRIVCVTLWGEYESRTPTMNLRSTDRARAHFGEMGVDATYFYGINAPKLGVDTKNPYERDAPGSGYLMGPKPTGCWLSHRALWAALLLLPDAHFFVVEDDARFPPDWRARMEVSMAALPSDWDMLYVGSCCTQGQARQHVGADVFAQIAPQCTHGYMVARKALETLISTQDAVTCYAPIDISLLLHSHDKLKVYTVLPRILEQHDMVLPE